APRIRRGRRDPGEGRRVALEGSSSRMRLAPLPGAQDSDGILRRHDYPTAAAFHGVSTHAIAALRYDGRHTVGVDLAQRLTTAAARSVGRHHGEVYRTQVSFVCEDLDLLHRRLRKLSADIERLLDDHDLGGLLTT